MEPLNIMGEWYQVERKPTLKPPVVEILIFNLTYENDVIDIASISFCRNWKIHLLKITNMSGVLASSLVFKNILNCPSGIWCIKGTSLKHSFLFQLLLALFKQGTLFKPGTLFKQDFLFQLLLALFNQGTLFKPCYLF